MKINLKGAIAYGTLVAIVLGVVIALTILFIIDSQTGYIKYAAIALSTILSNALRIP